MAAIVTPHSSAGTADANGLTDLGFFTKAFITDKVFVPGDHPNACHENTLPGVTLGNVHKSMFFFIWVVTSPNGIYSCAEGIVGRERKRMGRDHKVHCDLTLCEEDYPLIGSFLDCV